MWRAPPWSTNNHWGCVGELATGKQECLKAGLFGRKTRELPLPSKTYSNDNQSYQRSLIVNSCKYIKYAEYPFSSPCVAVSDTETPAGRPHTLITGYS